MNEGPNKTLWFFIVGMAVVAIAAAWVASNYLGVSVPGHDTTPITIRVAVAPEAYEAVRAAAAEYARGNPKLESRPIVVEVVSLDGVAALREMEGARFTPPAAWIPEAGWWLAFTQGSLPQPGFVASGNAAPQSIATTTMIWGAFEDRAAALQEYGGLSWNAIHDAPQGSLAIAAPNASVEGLAALIGAAADYHDRADLTEADFNNPDFRDWLRESLDTIPNLRALGGDPAQIIAEQGRATADVGYIAESDWLRRAEGIESRSGRLTFAYPPQTVMLDFPYAVWAGATAAEQTAALDFRTYLLGAWQSRLSDYGLRPPAGPANGGLFAKYSAQGVLAEPPAGLVTVSPGLLRVTRQWAASNTFAP